MEIKSKRSGLTIVLPDDEYGMLISQRGEHDAYEYVLNLAGRVLKHRRTLEKFRTQQLNAEQLAQIESLARSLAVSAVIDAEIVQMGYENYLRRRDRGGLMPPSFDRIVERAREAAAEKIKNVTITDDDRNYALLELGYLTDEDREWSERISGWCNWQITAPDGWGSPSS